MKYPLEKTGVAQALYRLVPGAVTFDVPLARISRWRIGGSADVVVRPRTIEEVQRVQGWL